VETLEKTKATPNGARASDLLRGDEFDELMRIKRSHRIEEGRVPCPACGVVVETKLNRCPFCESDIAAATALARETNRRLRELSGTLDQEHATRTRAVPKRRNFFQRLACLFQGDPEPDTSDILKSDPTATRILGNLAPGDAVRVLAQDGPWLQVKTPSSEIGWVYSTLKRKS
jgi:hypothetical protein